jgi:hypothetical protein
MCEHQRERERSHALGQVEQKAKAGRVAAVRVVDQKDERTLPSEVRREPVKAS